MKNVFMVMHGLRFTNGGITSVMLNRSQFLTRLGYNAFIVTFDDEEDYEKLEAKYKSVGRLHNNAKIINFFDYYRNKNTCEFDEKKFDESIEHYNKNYLIQKEYFLSKKFIRYFTSDGILVKCKVWSKDGKHLEKIDYYKNLNICSSHIYKDDILYKILDYNDQGEEIQVRFFTTDGFCYFQRSFLGDNKLLHLFVFDRKSKEVKGFNSYQKLHTFFLEELSSFSDKSNNIIICDGPGSTEKVALVSSEIAIKILTLHSNHFSAPYTMGAKLKGGVTPVFKYLDRVDAVVVLTLSQKKDLVSQFGNSEKFHVIQNTVSIPDLNSFIETKENKKRKINIASRYVGMKRLADVVTAVSMLIKAEKIHRSEIELNFYGSGSEKKNLISHINQLNMQDIVTVNNYISDVDIIFREADITLLTSTYEGFGLTMIEAMSNKTPVIAYDINYGPRDIITDGVDGYLIEPNNIEALSEKIYEVLFEKYDDLPKISENAYKKVCAKFSHEYAAKLWSDLLTNLYKKV